MVFENVTLFEVHLDDARFDARAGGVDGSDADPAEAVEDRAHEERVDDERAAESETAEASAGGRGRVAKLILASVVVSVAATVVARRFAGGDDDPVAVDLGAEEGGYDEAGRVDEADVEGPADGRAD